MPMALVSACSGRQPGQVSRPLGALLGAVKGWVLRRLGPTRSGHWDLAVTRWAASAFLCGEPTPWVWADWTKRLCQLWVDPCPLQPC